MEGLYGRIPVFCLHYGQCPQHGSYTGVINNLYRRVMEHKTGKGGTFTKKYNVTKLVYLESGNDVRAAIAREKRIKSGSRKKKEDLINSTNPEWKDLLEEYFP